MVERLLLGAKKSQESILATTATTWHGSLRVSSLKLLKNIYSLTILVLSSYVDTFSWDFSATSMQRGWTGYHLWCSQHWKITFSNVKIQHIFSQSWSSLLWIIPRPHCEQFLLEQLYTEETVSMKAPDMRTGRGGTKSLFCKSQVCVKC